MQKSWRTDGLIKLFVTKCVKKYSEWSTRWMFSQSIAFVQKFNCKFLPLLLSDFFFPPFHSLFREKRYKASRIFSFKIIFCSLFYFFVLRTDILHKMGFKSPFHSFLSLFAPKEAQKKTIFNIKSGTLKNVPPFIKSCEYFSFDIDIYHSYLMPSSNNNLKDGWWRRFPRPVSLRPSPTVSIIMVFLFNLFNFFFLLFFAILLFLSSSSSSTFSFQFSTTTSSSSTSTLFFVRALYYYYFDLCARERCECLEDCEKKSLFA